jgi:hypothetical protein
MTPVASRPQRAAAGRANVNVGLDLRDPPDTATAHGLAACSDGDHRAQPRNQTALDPAPDPLLLPRRIRPQRAHAQATTPLLRRRLRIPFQPSAPGPRRRLASSPRALTPRAPVAAAEAIDSSVMDALFECCLDWKASCQMVRDAYDSERLASSRE